MSSNRTTHFRTSLAFVLSCLSLMLLSLNHIAQAQELLTNGDFETGDFTGWTLVNGGGGSFFIFVPGADTPPAGGFFFPTAPNPDGGAFYAVSTSDEPGQNALQQNFTVPNGTAYVLLSFQLFVNDQSGFGGVVDPSGLDFTTGGTFNDNQHARVDIIHIGVADFSTAPADVVDNYYVGADSVNLLNPYLNYSVYVSSVLLQPGSTYTLRFAGVDNLSALNVGVDNVSAFATAMPEPGNIALLCAVGASGLFMAINRYKRK